MSLQDLLLNPFNPERPDDLWRIPPELLELLDNEGRAYFSPEGRAALNRIALGAWFLVRNRGELGDVVANRRCRRCNQQHPYVSVACVPAPFNGLRQLHVVLRQATRRDLATRPLGYADVEVISAADARRLNDRIRERRGTPPVDQHPPRRGELDGERIRARIVARAHRIRQALAAGT